MLSSPKTSYRAVELSQKLIRFADDFLRPLSNYVSFLIYHVLLCYAVALGTPSLLQNLPRQQSNQDLDDDSSQDAEDISVAGGLGPASASETETSVVDGSDVTQGDVASSSHQVILRLLEDGETVSFTIQHWSV